MTLNETNSECMNGRVPIESPLDSGEEYERLESMLNGNASPMILDPTFTDRFCEWYADARAQDEHGIAEGQCSRVF